MPVSPLPPPAVAPLAPADAVAALVTSQPLSMNLLIAAGVLKTMSISVWDAPSCAPALAAATFMNEFLLDLLSCTSPVPPEPPIRKLTP